VGPGLVAPDLNNNALPLYLSRPFSRFEYILGKLAVLLGLTSLITWLPGLLVVALQVNVAGLSWLRENPQLPVGVIVGSWVWIMTISLIALAISAWVKLKPIATATLFGVFFALAAFGQAANGILDLNPRWGSLLSLPTTMSMIWTWLFSSAEGYQQFLQRSARVGNIPVAAAFATMLAVCGIALFLLVRKVRGSEVIRG
jgi:ABC-2 type transport system permease protein